jgi:hypothetical protein
VRKAHDNVQDVRRTISIARNICQSGLSIFQDCRRVSADNWGPQSGRNRQSLAALRAIQHCELGARQAAEKSVGNPSSAAIGLDGRLTPDLSLTLIARLLGESWCRYDKQLTESKNGESLVRGLLTEARQSL